MAKVKLYDVRLSFPDLFTPRAVNQGDTPAYSASFILPPDHEDIPAIRAAIQEAAEAKWGDKAIATLQQLSAQDRLCLHNGDLKDYDGYAGNLYIAARSKVKPGVFDRDKTPLTAESGKPYSGCYVNAIIDIYANAHPTGGKRICASLVGVQFVADGEAFAGGRAATADDFEDITDIDEGMDFTAQPAPTAAAPAPAKAPAGAAW